MAKRRTTGDAETTPKSSRKKSWNADDLLSQTSRLQERIGRFKALATKLRLAEIETIEIDGDAGLARSYQQIDLFLARADLALAIAQVKKGEK